MFHVLFLRRILQDERKYWSDNVWARVDNNRLSTVKCRQPFLHETRKRLRRVTYRGPADVSTATRKYAGRRKRRSSSTVRVWLNTTVERIRWIESSKRHWNLIAIRFWTRLCLRHDDSGQSYANSLRANAIYWVTEEL